MGVIRRLTCVAVLAIAAAARAADPPLDYRVQIDVPLKHDDGQFLWYHPRAATVPNPGGEPTVVVTLQKHLRVSDYYGGLHVLKRRGLNGPWSGPELPPALDWQKDAKGVTVSVADVTPGWHAPTGRLIAIGCQVRYSPAGQQLEDVARAHQTVYAVYDPKRDSWGRWQVLAMPPDAKFNFCRNACAQWLVEADGTLLVPVYFGPDAKQPHMVTVLACRFDGERLTYQRHGDELRLPIVRGLVEPSLARFGGRYFLTIRNDKAGYVTVSDDGRKWAPIKEWTFDDGQPLGSYNTQQHWLAHSDGLFLVYTRRGANNDHIVRHRAPLFVGRVDADRLCVVRASERVVVPERGAELGNFGVAAVSPDESWVTVSEGLWNEASRKKGADGSTFVARVIWSRPNRQYAADR
ncbi:MAG: hypothetical protein U0746_09545 [Gemmataceae bacterium]